MIANDDERRAFAEEYRAMAPFFEGRSTTVLTCRVCGHEWISWPASLCPLRGRHPFAAQPGEWPEPRIARGEE